MANAGVLIISAITFLGLAALVGQFAGAFRALIVFVLAFAAVDALERLLQPQQQTASPQKKSHRVRKPWVNPNSWLGHKLRWWRLKKAEWRRPKPITWGDVAKLVVGIVLLEGLLLVPTLLKQFFG